MTTDHPKILSSAETIDVRLLFIQILSSARILYQLQSSCTAATKTPKLRISGPLFFPDCAFSMDFLAFRVLIQALDSIGWHLLALRHVGCMVLFKITHIAPVHREDDDQLSDCTTEPLTY